jgi:tetratricopeptide (TPR) repeat protein
MFMNGDGVEVDWIVGYGPPPENFQAKLEKIMKGENTVKTLQDSFAKNPKDAALAFRLARKWGDRYNDAKTREFYEKVLALDPQGKAGQYTHEWTKITAPYREYAEFALATLGMNSAKPDLAPIRAFIAKYPKSPLYKEAWSRMSGYFGYQASKEEAAKFFPEYAAKFPEERGVLGSWLARIVQDKEPIAKGVELAEKLQQITRDNPDPSLNSQMAQIYDMKGDKAKAEELYGREFMEGQVQSLGYNLIDYANYWMEKDANKDSALAMAETAMKLEPDNTYFIQQTAGIYFKVGQEAKAMALFGPAYMKKNMADGGNLYGYATFWARQGKNLDSALVAAKRAVELKPATYYYWSGLADVYSKMKNHAEAIKAAEKAVELAEGQTKDYMKKNLEKIKTAAGQK